MTQRRTPPPGYVTQSPNIEYWAEEFQFDHWRAMDPLQKAEVMTILHRASIRPEMEALRQAFPHATEEELGVRLAERRYGREFVDKMIRHAGD
jgi:hypothetical protein